MTVQEKIEGASAAVVTALSLVDVRAVDEALGRQPLDRLHFGNEFCETLLPSPGHVAAAIAAAERRGLGFALVTPMLSDGTLERLRPLLPMLPDGAEVIANDWGTLHLLRRAHPRLVPVAGRLMCKMVKDPRLPSAEWARLYPHGIHSRAFGKLLASLGVARIEMDVPPFAAAADFRSRTMRVSVHAPYGYSVKGRACRIGSLHQPDGEKFSTGHRCRKECLTYVADLSRPTTGTVDLATFQRGNTVFYRHSPAMTSVVQEALAQGWIDRIIVSGDWNENRCAHQ